MNPRRRWLAGSLLGLVILAAASEFLVPALIGVLHRGTGVAALDGILAGRTAHSAGYYVERWRSFARPALAALGVLWALAAVAFHPAVAAPLARMLERASGGRRLGPEPALPPPGRRRLVTVLASVIAGGSLLELALDPPYRGEHWPFSQYQMYSLLPQSRGRAAPPLRRGGGRRRDARSRSGPTTSSSRSTTRGCGSRGTVSTRAARGIGFSRSRCATVSTATRRAARRGCTRDRGSRRCGCIAFAGRPRP